MMQDLWVRGEGEIRSFYGYWAPDFEERYMGWAQWDERIRRWICNWRKGPGSKNWSDPFLGDPENHVHAYLKDAQAVVEARVHEWGDQIEEWP